LSISKQQFWFLLACYGLNAPSIWNGQILVARIVKQ
jgi:hypothetical protein